MIIKLTKEYTLGSKKYTEINNKLTNHIRSQKTMRKAKTKKSHTKLFKLTAIFFSNIKI